MAASDYDSSGSDSEPENVEQIVRQAASRLGQKKTNKAAEQKHLTTKVKNLEKYNRQAPLSQKKIKVGVRIPSSAQRAWACWPLANDVAVEWLHADLWS